MDKHTAKISEFSRIIGMPFYGKDIEIEALGLCNRESKQTSILSYVSSPEHVYKAVENPSVKAFFITQQCVNEAKERALTYIISDSPEEDFYKLHTLLYERTSFYEKFDFDSIVGGHCCIHPTAIIERGVKIGDHVTIGAYSIVRSGSIIGNGCHIGSLSVIGSDGFQILRKNNGVPYNVIHVGGTLIGDNVWIGDHVTISKALFAGKLIIGDDCYIDNHCFIAHNCKIGNKNVLTGGVVMLGSAEVRNNCWLAPGAIILNRIIIEDDVFVGANSTVAINPKQGTIVMGNPAMEMSKFAKIQRAIRNLVKNR